MARAQHSRFWWCALAAPLLFACGGSAVTGPGGSAAAGASGASGGASAGAAGGSCEYQGQTYADGARFPASDGCNTCACQAGSLSCTEIGCSAGCQSGGQFYQPGQTFKIDCNTCTCQADGQVGCTKIACPDQCAALQDQYAVALKRAKACDPKQPAQCTAVVAALDLRCGCATPVNANDVNALNELSDLAKQAQSQCIAVPCAPCEELPGPATCTEAGSCEIAPFRPGEAACKVGSIIYPHGASGIQAPGDCNTCACDNGELGPCTKKACPDEFACPKGTFPGTQCAQCGPTDACQIVDNACLPTCTDTCANGVCLNGLCRQICG